MKNCIAILFLILSSFVTNAQQLFKPTWHEIPKANTIKINLLSPLMNAVTLAYEKELSNEVSLQIIGSYMDFGDIFTTDYDQENIKSFQITPEARQVILGNERDMIYVGVFLRYIYADYRYKHEDEVYYNPYPYNNGQSVLAIHERNGKYHSIGLGILAERKFTFKNKFVIDMFAGPAYTRIVNAYSREIKTNQYVYAGYNPSYDKTTRNTNEFYGRSLIPNAYMNAYGIRAGIMLGYKF